MSYKCFICCTEDVNSIRNFTELATMSGKSILDIIIDTLGLKCVDLNSMACQLCFELIDEIDAFEHSLLKSKEKLRNKFYAVKETSSNSFEDYKIEVDYVDNISDHEEKIITTSIPTFTLSDNPVLIDRLLIKANWKKKCGAIINEVQEDMDHFENYLETICINTPLKIDSIESSLSWTKELLRHSIDNMEYNIEGELQCFECSAIFKSVYDRINHFIENHVKILECFIYCNHCHKIFHQENEAFQHRESIHESNPNLKSVQNNLIVDATLFHCKKCSPGFSFNNELVYLFHTYKRHPKYNEIKTCPICSLDVPTLNAYRRHILIQHSAYVFQCQKCPVVFEDSDADIKMLEHIKIHDEQKIKPKSKMQGTKLDNQCESSKMEQLISKSKLAKKGGYISKYLARSYRYVDDLHYQNIFMHQYELIFALNLSTYVNTNSDLL